MTLRRYEIPRLMTLILVFIAMKSSHASPIEFSLAVKGGVEEATTIAGSARFWHSCL